ncbi:hypothetical protein DIPPA_10058 [Diplonema papillatum]|nr:hypothetical protein DIPPA_10058 [Diplonema papillatum]
MLAAFFGAALAVGTFHMPVFSWDTVPVFIHMCDPEGPFNTSELEYLAKFPMVTVEKGQGINATAQPYAGYPEEEKILQALQAVKEINDKVVTIFYYNSILDWNMYHMHEILEANPAWWLRDAAGQVVRLHGDSTFPQPSEGMLVFDMAQQVVQEFWASECINITSSPYADGCFADQTMKNLENITKYNFTEQQKQEFSKGHEAAVLLVQRTLNETGNSVLVTNRCARGFCLPWRKERES